MLLFYVDEFGDHSMAVEPSGDSLPTLKSGVSKCFVLAAVGVRDTSRKPLAEALVALKERHFGPFVREEPWGASEIKGRFLFRVARSVASGHTLQHPKAYRCLDTVGAVERLIRDLDLLLAKFRPLVFSVAVDKVALLARSVGAGKQRTHAPPLGAAYAYLQQRVALTMEQLYAGDSASLVADQQTQHEQYFRSGGMNTVRDELTATLPLQPNFNLVLDKPLWIDTELSTWDREILQLADVVAYSVGECLKRGEPPQEPCYLWSRLQQLMAVHWSTGRIEAGGLAIYPKPSAYPV